MQHEEIQIKNFVFYFLLQWKTDNSKAIKEYRVAIGIYRSQYTASSLGICTTLLQFNLLSLISLKPVEMAGCDSCVPRSVITCAK